MQKYFSTACLSLTGASRTLKQILNPSQDSEQFSYNFSLSNGLQDIETNTGQDFEQFSYTIFFMNFIMKACAFYIYIYIIISNIIVKHIINLLDSRKYPKLEASNLIILKLRKKGDRPQLLLIQISLSLSPITEGEIWMRPTHHTNHSIHPS